MLGMEPPLREIIMVELSWEDKMKSMVILDTFPVDTMELLELPEEALAQIFQRASDCLPGMEVLRLSYKDDEADWCTLGRDSLRDALIFASATQVNDCGVLRLRVTTNQTASASAASLKSEDANLGPQNVATHNGPACFAHTASVVRCDGCGAVPVGGPRFRCLDLPDYELCSTCYSETLLQPAAGLHFVQVGTPAECVGEQLKPNTEKAAGHSDTAGLAHSASVVKCDGCGAVPVEGPRFRCLDLPDFNLCSTCYSNTLLEPASGLHFVRVDDPAACVREQLKPNTDESQLINGAECHGEKCRSLQPLVEIAEESRGEDLEAQLAELQCLHAAELKATMDRELAEVVPMVEDAKQELANVRRNILQDVLALRNPPQAVRMTFEAAALMVNPDVGMPPRWDAVRKAMRNHKFLPSLMNFDAETLTDSVCDFIRRTYLAHPQWCHGVIVKASKAAGPFYHFVQNHMEFASVLRRLKPLRDELKRFEQLADAKTGAQANQEELARDSVGLESPSVPEEATRRPDLESTGEAALRKAMDQLLRHADPAIRSAAAEALCDAKEHEAEAPTPTDTLASTGDGMSELVATPSMADSLPATSAASARVVSSSPLVLGIEAEEADASCGDVTERRTEFLAPVEGARQVFSMGRILVPIGSDIPPVPACAKLVIVNDGKVPWPDAAAVAHRSGDDMDVASMRLGCIEPGSGCEVSLDLLVPPSAEPKESSSTWAVIDEASGIGLGPVLLFEVEWTEQVTNT